MDTRGRGAGHGHRWPKATDSYGEKIRKPNKPLPDQVDPPSHSIRLGSATSSLPQPLQAAVDASGRWKVPRFLREELAIVIQAYGQRCPSDALAGRFRRSAGRSVVRFMVGVSASTEACNSRCFQTVNQSGRVKNGLDPPVDSGR